MARCKAFPHSSDVPGTTPVVKAKKEPAVIPGGFASLEAIAQIMTQKFVMGAPLYRQEQELQRMGVRLSRQTMSNWILRATEDWLKPILDVFWIWPQSRHAAPQSTFGKAVSYLLEQWPYLTEYINDGRLEISNNRAERSIKPFVIDRKNFLFANTPSGAHGSAIIFSLIETAKENGLNPYAYLLSILLTALGLSKESGESLLPWNAPEDCKNTK